jgi:hypothetical protein
MLGMIGQPYLNFSADSAQRKLFLGLLLLLCLTRAARCSAV